MGSMEMTMTEQANIYAVTPLDGATTETLYPGEVRDRLEELRDGREGAIAELLRAYHTNGHPTAEGRLAQLNRHLYDLSEAEYKLRIAELDADRQLQTEIRELRASQERAAVEASSATQRRSMPRWLQIATAMLPFMIAHP